MRATISNVQYEYDYIAFIDYQIMNLDFYDKFLSCKTLGDRDGARCNIQLFCDSFVSFEEKAIWTRSFLESGDYGHRIRYELYENVIFPVLRDGYQRRDFWSTLWLARTCRNLREVKDCLDGLSFATGLSLLHECYQIDPDHDSVREELLAKKVQWLDFCIHEWPAGVLYGMDGATYEECKDILEVIEFVRALDVSNDYHAFFDDVEWKTVQYMARKISYAIQHNGEPQ